MSISFILLIVTFLGIAFYWGEPQALWITNAFLFLMALAIFTITQNVFSASIRPLHYAYLTICYSILSLCLFDCPPYSFTPLN